MKKIGFWTALALVVGNILGVGIFTTTGYLADKITNPYVILLAWLVGAVYAFTGAKVYGFLAQNMPYRGGDYVYLKRHYHPYFSYLYGWSGLFITYTGSIAALGIGAAYYLNDIIPNLNLAAAVVQTDLLGVNISITGIKISGILIILFFTYLNHLGLQTGGKTQLLLTTAIVLLMTGYIIVGYFSGANTIIVDDSVQEKYESSIFFVSLVGVLFTYMGWTTVVYIANEVKDPKRTIPRALILGIVIVAALYMSINYVFLSTFSAHELANDVNVASKVAHKLWGAQTTRIIAAMILIAILSSLNSTVLSGARIFQAMAGDGYLWKKMATIHTRYDTPHVSIWTQGIWSIILLLSGTFNQLLTIVVAAILLFSIMSGTVAFKLLYREYITQRILNSLLLVSNIIYLLLCSSILINIIINQFKESLIGFIILSISFPIYLFQATKLKKQ